MLKLLEKWGLDVRIQRKIGLIVVAVLALSRIWFLKPMFSFFDISIIGYIDIATIVGAIGALFIWQVYKRYL